MFDQMSKYWKKIHFIEKGGRTNSCVKYVVNLKQLLRIMLSDFYHLFLFFRLSYVIAIDVGVMIGFPSKISFVLGDSLRVHRSI